MATYRVFAGNPIDFALYGEIPFSTLQFSDVLNRAGSISITMPLLDSNSIPASFVTPASTALWVERNGDIIWGGLLWTVDVDLVGQTVNMAGEGWLSYYDHRVLTTNFNSGAFTPGQIEQDVAITMYYILRSTREDMGINPTWAFPYPLTPGVPNIDINTWQIAQFAGGYGWNVYGSRDVAERLSIGELIEQVLSGSFNTAVYGDNQTHSLDYALVPSWNVANNRPQVQWYGWNNRRGQSLAKPLSLTSGITSLNITMDGTKQANQIYVLGSGGSELPPTGSYYTSVLPGSMRLDKALSGTLDSGAACDVYARDAAIALQYPHILPQISLLGDNPEWEWSSYSVGDTFQLDVDSGFLDSTTVWRIQEKSTTVDTSGTDMVTITVADNVLFD